MIQDISPHVFHNEFTSSAPESSDTVFVFGQRQVLAVWEHDGSIIFPKAGAFRKSVLRYLFRIDDRRYYLYLPESYEHEYEYEEKIPGTDGFDFISMMDVRRSSDLAAMFACMTAYHLFTWYDRNRFCGRCGQPLQHAEAERMLCCPVCGNAVFPTIAPAVIVGVIDGERLLMTRYAGRAYKGWALIAGFCEIGETVEDTVRREVLEEVGIHVKNLRYVTSQPWGVDSNLLIGVFCEAEGETAIDMDQEELSQAVWVNRSDVPEMKDNHSLTGYMIEMFRNEEESS